MRLLGVDEPVLPELLPLSRSRMEASYPELRDGWERISSVAYAEEESFRATLRAGTQLFDLAVLQSRSNGSTVVGGDAAFRLHDTYGFPIDLTLEMAAEQGLTVDEDGFRRLMAEQRQRAKADAKAKKSGHVDLSVYRSVADTLGRPVEFLGYEQVTAEGTVAGLVRDEEPAASARAGDDVEVVLDRTPFYAEGGGQLADTGRLVLDGAELEVLDVQAPIPGLIVHRARVVAGEVVVGAGAEAVVDVDRRRAISRSHTATHMVHKAFREALGETAAQAGSENAPGRFRFDFGATGPVPPSVLRDVEARVNALVVDDLLVHAEYMSLEQARRSGAMALFGEKYGETVRVVSVGDWARELCGGTHVHNSGQLGVVTLLGEASIGQGVRRVEALVGHDAYRYLAREHVLLHEITEIVKGRPEELPERIGGLIARLKDAERELARLRSAQLIANIDGVVGEGTQLGDLRVWAFRAPDGLPAQDLRQLVTRLSSRARPELAITALASSVSDGKVALVAFTNPRARELGVSAARLLQAVLPAVSGRGGGKDDIAQGAGTDPAGLDAALDAFVVAAGRAAGVTGVAGSG
jgi:alanyl-tRNA synthetase